MAGIKFQCGSCGQHLEAPPEAADCALACPNCNAAIRVPSVSQPSTAPPAQPAPAAAVAAGPVCSICQCELSASDAKTSCPSCNAQYHTDCWQENQGCAIYGCADVPKIEQRRSIEIPISYWGQENKPCPNCNRDILAAAVRCRFCGATFSSARPEDADAFQDRTALEERLPGMKRNVVIIFVLSILPCLAPIGAIWGLIWFSLNRKRLSAMPAVYGALCKIGLAVSIGQIVLIIVMALAYAATRPPSYLH